MKYGIKYGHPLVSLDITAHELTHAVTNSTSGLAYKGESGALDEGISDVMAICAEKNAKPNKTDNEIWQIGEDTYLIRNIKDLNCKYYHGNGWRNTNDVSEGNDYGGVHDNSGVFSYWFYLLSKGGNYINEGGFRLPVDSIGMDKAMQICYLMNTSYLTSNSSFTDAKECSYYAARALGYGDDIMKQIHRAWVNVGVEELGAYINGPASFCTEATYNVEYLPVGWTVEWQFAPSNIAPYPILTQNDPVSNLCTIRNQTNYVYSNKLKAILKYNGSVMKTIEKNVSVVQTNQFYASYRQEACSYHDVSHPAIPAKQIYSGAVEFVHQGCLVFLTSSWFAGRTVTHTGGIPEQWGYDGNKMVYFSIPYGSGGVPFHINVMDNENDVNSGDCDCSASVLFFGISGNGNVSHSLQISISGSETTFSLEKQVDVSEVSSQLGIQRKASEDISWEIDIVRVDDIKSVYSNKVNGATYTIDTSGWREGFYVATAIINGEKITDKFYIRK